MINSNPNKAGGLFGYKVTESVAIRAPYFFIILATIYFFTLILPYVHVYPYSDEWEYVSHFMSGKSISDPSWLFSRHGDHTIPIQKLLHGVLLKLSGFDWRVIVATNYLLAVIMALACLRIARLYRGSVSLFDLIIPIAVLSYGHGYTQWGFEFQFLSSVFFVVAFAYFMILAKERANPWMNEVAVVMLVLCSLSGLNGLVVSTIVLTLFLVNLIVDRIINGTPWRFSLLGAVAMALLIISLLWLNWSPSEASTETPNLKIASEFFVGLFNSSFIVYAFDHSIIPGAVLGVSFISAIVIFARAIIKGLGQNTLSVAIGDFAIISVILATFLLMLGLSYGRSRYQGGWTPGLEMHYGFLTILIPLFSWIFVSSKTNLAWIVGVLLLYFYASAFYENAIWRSVYIKQSASEIAAIQYKMSNVDYSADAIVKEHIEYLHFDDSVITRTKLVKGIEYLRASGGYIYSLPAHP